MDVLANLASEHQHGFLSICQANWLHLAVNLCVNGMTTLAVKLKPDKKVNLSKVKLTAFVSHTLVEVLQHFHNEMK